MTSIQPVEARVSGGHGAHLDPALREQLRDWRASVRAGMAALQSARAPCLVVVGPNNAGKTSLVRLLGAREAEPSALGGATTRVVIHGAAGDPRAWLEGSESGGAVEQDHGWLLADTPDFDGHCEDHHLRAAHAVRAADLVALVVTPLVYANARVHEFIGLEVIDRGVPWLLVVRGGDDLEARRISTALGAQLGSGPVATYSWEGAAPLRVDPGPMRTSLHEDLATRAVDLAGLRQGRAALRRHTLREGEALLRRIGQRRERLQALLDRARADLREVGHGVAMQALPLEEAVLALRELLDPRVHPLRRALRSGTARLGRFLRKSPEAVGLDLHGAERRALEVHLPGLLRRLEGHLREALAAGVGPACSEPLEQWLRPVRRGEALDAGRTPTPAPASDRAAFREELRVLLEGALSERGGEAALQLQMDLVLTTPMALGSLIALKTGGLGSDLVVGGLGILSSAWLERLASHLGASVAEEARTRWARRAAARLEEHLEASLWSRCEEALRGELLGLSRAEESVALALRSLGEEVDP
ncbi:MAG: 50S ribosome-binding GTPase [Planctomycetes bacterium]|nr:50S ribosome-binding GTPase [Planctomycetota bacterium]